MADDINRKKWTGRWTWSAGAWGWAISLLFHVGLAVVFLLVNLSSSPSGQKRKPPIGTIEEAAKPLQADPIITDLKMEALKTDALIPDRPAPIATEFGAPGAGQGLERLAIFEDGSSGLSVPQAGGGSGRLYQSQFCGTAGEAAGICYVVDCSGSMVIAFDYVRRELKNAIGNLTPAQYFHVIFYAGDNPIELPAKRLIRANTQNRRQAWEFVDKITLATVESAEAAAQSVAGALGQALEVSSASGRPAELVYLLTDGGYDHQFVRKRLDVLQAERGRPARINVIACGNRDNENFLRNLAHAYQGQYRFVSDEELAAGQ
jgi:hypothetical protein